MPRSAHMIRVPSGPLLNYVWRPSLAMVLSLSQSGLSGACSSALTASYLCACMPPVLTPLLVLCRQRCVR